MPSRPIASSTACGVVGIVLTTHGARAGTLIGMVEIGVGALFCLLALSLGSSAAPTAAPVHGEGLRSKAS